MIVFLVVSEVDVSVETSDESLPYDRQFITMGMILGRCDLGHFL